MTDTPTPPSGDEPTQPTPPAPTPPTAGQPAQPAAPTPAPPPAAAAPTAPVAPAAPVAGFPAPPALTAAPTTAPLAPGQWAPPPRDNKKTIFVLLAVVVVVVLVGVVGTAAAVVFGGDDEPAVQETIDPIAPQPDPDSGPQVDPAPSPAPVPGPTPSPTVPSPPPTDPDPSPTTPAPNPTGGDQVDLGGGIGFTLPSGWQQDNVSAGFAQVSTQGGYFVVTVSPEPTQMDALIQSDLQMLANSGVQELEYTTPEAIALPTSAVTEAKVINYRGLLASQQGGTTAIEGFGYFFLRQDGIGVGAIALFPKDGFPPLQDAYNIMVNSLVQSL